MSSLADEQPLQGCKSLYIVGGASQCRCVCVCVCVGGEKAWFTVSVK